MNAIQVISVSLTGLSLLSTLICGLWMRYSGEVITDANKNFHMGMAVLSMIFVATTIVLMVQR